MNFHEISLSKRKNLKTLVKAKTKIIALEGGSGSGKSYDALFYLIYICQQNKNAGLRIMIGRAFYSWIDDSILADFKRVLQMLDLWEGKLTKESHPKEHKLYGNTFHFRGADQEAKFHGPRWDLVYLNEGMEFKYESCSNVFMRTNHKILIDWNPYLMQHWVYNRILPREDCTHVTSTFFDNPDLPDEQRKEILGYEPSHPDDRHIQDKKKRRPHPINLDRGTADDRLWSVYGEGKRMAPEGLIFKHVNYIDEWPIDVAKINAMDFGFSVDPHAMGHVGETERDIYIELLSYEPIETASEIDLLAEKVGMNKKRQTIGDSSDKYTGENKGTVEMVKDLRLLGWSIQKVSKTKSVMFWLGKMKKKRINIINNHLAFHAKKEQENYVMKTINGIAINQPVDKFNHMWDMCFIGETLISTELGLKPIEQIKTGDYVYTSTGLNKVIHKHNNGKKTISKYRIHLDMYSLSLYCTDNHKVKTDKGWVEISKLQSGMMVYLNNSLTAKDIDYIQKKGISQGDQKECTPKCGNIITAQLKRLIIFIIKTKIPGTTILKIWKKLRQIFINHTTSSNGTKIIQNGPKNFQGWAELLLKYGINQRRAESGTNSKPYYTDSEKENMKKENVEYVRTDSARKHHTRDFAQTIANQGIEERPDWMTLRLDVQDVANYLKQTNIEAQKVVHVSVDGSEERNVYDLSVENEHEYFANGVLVHNCRYGFMALNQSSEIRATKR